MDKNVLDRGWRTGALLCFAMPTIAMMLSMGLYTLVDTLFVARFLNTNALSAVNIVCPAINLTVGLGTMLSTGGSAVVSRKMGAGRQREARENFTLLVTTGGVTGFVLLLLGILWIDEIVSALGANEALFPDCREYLLTLLFFFPANMLQTLFASLFVTAGKPGLGFGLSAAAGMVNIILDYVFLVPCQMGIAGAALGTGIGYLLPAAAGLAYFSKERGSLYFCRPGLDWGMLGQCCLNGSSELVSQLATAVTTFLFNRTMLALLGEDGVAAITILIYTQFLLSTLYIGFSMGVAPVISFLYGRGDVLQLRAVFRTCMGFLGVSSLLVLVLSRAGGPAIARLFTGTDTRVSQITAEGFSIVPYGFLFCGLNIFISAMFTALSNGRCSAGLSFLRTFGLLATGILFLPRLWGVTGVWLAVPLAEGVMAVLSAGCVALKWKTYFGIPPSA